MINISFAVTVCNEAFELNRLLNQLKESVIEGDEVVIQVDDKKSTNEFLKVVSENEIELWEKNIRNLLNQNNLYENKSRELENLIVKNLDKNRFDKILESTIFEKSR